jgi:hypothetical protein
VTLQSIGQPAAAYNPPAPVQVASTSKAADLMGMVDGYSGTQQSKGSTQLASTLVGATGGAAALGYASAHMLTGAVATVAATISGAAALAGVGAIGGGIVAGIIDEKMHGGEGFGNLAASMGGAVIGGVGGAVTGAVVGLKAGATTQNVLIAGAGALVGGAVGYFFGKGLTGH